jgi:hypothetical protein
MGLEEKRAFRSAGQWMRSIRPVHNRFQRATSGFQS